MRHMVNLMQLLLTEAFGDDQKKKWLAEDPNLTADVIDDYILRFDRIRKIKPSDARNVHIEGLPVGDNRFDISKYKDWHTFESFVDAVGAVVPLKPVDIEVDGKPLFVENGLEVYYADSQKACISYKGNIPYTWCIAAKQGNMFLNYRTKSRRPSFYFVKDIEETKKELETWNGNPRDFKNKWHFMVIQVLSRAKIDNPDEKDYIVTNANNRDPGDTEMSWNEIVEVQPKLKGLQSKFLPKPLSDEDANKINYFRSGNVKPSDFVKLSFEDKEFYVDIVDGEYNDKIFELLPPVLKLKHINYNRVLSTNQYESIKSDTTLYKRYLQKLSKRLEDWVESTDGYYPSVDTEYVYAFIDSGLMDKYINDLTQKQINYLLQMGPPNILTYLNKHLSKLKISKSKIFWVLHNNRFSPDIIKYMWDHKINITDDLTLYFYRIYDENKEFAEIVYNYLIKRKVPKNKILSVDNILTMLSKSNFSRDTINYLTQKNVNWTSIAIEDSYQKDKLKKALEENYLLLSDTQFKNLLSAYGSNVNKRQKVIDALAKRKISFTYKQLEQLLSLSTTKLKTITSLMNNDISLNIKNIRLFLKTAQLHGEDVQKLAETIAGKKNVTLKSIALATIFFYCKNIDPIVNILLKNGLKLSHIFNKRIVESLITSRNIDYTLDVLSKYRVKITSGIIYALFENPYKRWEISADHVNKFFDKIKTLNIVPLNNKILFALFGFSKNVKLVFETLISLGYSADKIITSLEKYRFFDHHLLDGLMDILPYDPQTYRSIVNIFVDTFVPYRPDATYSKVFKKLLMLSAENRSRILDYVTKNSERLFLTTNDFAELAQSNVLTPEQIERLRKHVYDLKENIMSYQDFYSFLF